MAKDLGLKVGNAGADASIQPLGREVGTSVEAEFTRKLECVGRAASPAEAS